MNNFLDTLKEKKDLVWPEIKIYLDDSTNFPPYCEIPSRYSSLRRFHETIVADYPKRKGKYLRPTLVLLTAQTMGFSEKKALKTAAAMQISEDWILAHDDIEDDSLERRGKPTLHRLYSKELALNAGDALHIVMWKVLGENLKILGEKKGLAIYNEFVTMLGRTIFGQTAEIKWTQENKIDLKDKDVFFILESKTAYYTIAGPMRLGAILAGASKKQLELIYQFGQYLGRCFQIKDDLLDLTSDFKGLKKQKGNDIYEGKRTIMLIHLLNQIKGEDKKRLVIILAKDRASKTAGEVNWVIKMMKKYGSLEYSEELARDLTIKAKKFFDQKLTFLAKEPARSQLKAGISFVLERKH